MVLNPNLYRLLRQEYGTVKIINAGQERIEARHEDRYVVEDRGEHYNVCCPLCGDQRFRLSVSYRWLMKSPYSGYRNKTLAHCYNEECELTAEEFINPLIEELELIEMGLVTELQEVPNTVSELPKNSLRLPAGLTPLVDLDREHPAWVFLRQKYPQLPEEVFTRVNAQYGGEYDHLCPSAYRRVVFPITSEGKVVAWQGRAIDQDVVNRWFLPPGFQKCLYNADSVSDIDVPILCEGITSSLATGPSAVAMFGSTLTPKQLMQLKQRWSSVLIATDPETFVPDNRKKRKGIVVVDELRKFLEPHVRVQLLQWPSVILEIARRHNNGSEIRVPDAADLGTVFMRKLVKASL